MYKVTVHQLNCWNQYRDGNCSLIVERECDHKHRTLKGAIRCMHKLQNDHKILWHRAGIMKGDQVIDHDDYIGIEYDMGLI
jgi:hypothetical protein